MKRRLSFTLYSYLMSEKSIDQNTLYFPRGVEMQSLLFKTLADSLKKVKT